MPAPVPLPIRQAIWARHQANESVTELARTYGLAPRTVRGLIQRGRQRGVEGLAADPTVPAARERPNHPAYEAAIQLRRQHPGWGSDLIRVMLAEQGLAPLPAARSLRRWFAAAGLNPAPPGRRPQSERRRARAPHQTWQVDAAEEMRLADGSRVCWLRIADEFTGAVLGTAIFPPRALERRARDLGPGAAPRGVRPLGAARPGPRR
jgi:transposase InsO family protein